MFQTSDPVVSVLLLVGIVGYALYLLLATRVVTARTLLLPVVVALYLGARYVDWANTTAVLAIGGGAVLGIALGAVSGRLVRVWRAADGLVYQQGSARYAAVLAGLIVARVGAYALLVHGGHGPVADALTGSFLAMAAGLYLGRTASVGVRALALVGWEVSALGTARTRSSLVAH